MKEEYEKLKAAIKEAIESGKETNWVYNGEDEVGIDVYNVDEALKNVMAVIDNTFNLAE